MMLGEPFVCGAGGRAGNRNRAAAGRRRGQPAQRARNAQPLPPAAVRENKKHENQSRSERSCASSREGSAFGERLAGPRSEEAYKRLFEKQQTRVQPVP